jgi:hypothetical protein
MDAAKSYFSTAAARDINAYQRHVRFTPKSGHVLCKHRCPLSAKSGRLPKSNAYRPTRVLVVIVAAISFVITPRTSSADQGGIGFWLPGTFGSLAATPMQPGLSMSTLYLHSFVSAGGGVAASRTIGFPNRPVNLSVDLNAQIKGTADVVAFGPTYVFATPVLGGQFAITALEIVGHQQANVDATVTGALGPIGFATESSISDSRTAFGDVFLQPTLRWNQGVNNYMIYGMMNLPVGAYDSSRLANLGLGHWSIDGGAGYTYFDPKQAGNFRR